MNAVSVPFSPVGTAKEIRIIDVLLILEKSDVCPRKTKNYIVSSPLTSILDSP
jgi:hypothetical protein